MPKQKAPPERGSGAKFVGQQNGACRLSGWEECGSKPTNSTRQTPHRLHSARPQTKAPPESAAARQQMGPAAGPRGPASATGLPTQRRAASSVAQRGETRAG